MSRPFRTHYIWSALALAASIFCANVSPAQAQLVPQVVGGSDNGRNARVLLTDSSGRLQVVGSASGGTVYGPDAPNTTATQSPLRIGGCSLPLTNTCTVRNAVVDANGGLFISGYLTTGTGGIAGNGFMVGGSDGTNYRHFSVNSQGQVFVNGPNTTGVTSSSISGLMIGGSDGTNYRHLKTDTSGQLIISPTNLIMTGNIASGATDSGNPVKVGGIYNSTLPTFTTGQRGDLQVNNRGSLNVILSDGANGYVTTVAISDAMGGTPTGVTTASYGALYNGATEERARSISGIPAGGTAGVAGVTQVPNNTTAAGIVPVVTSALASNLVLKASAGNLYRARVTATANGYLMLFNATSAPVDGAVTPQSCTVVSANSTVEIDHQIPDRFSTGITAVYSSTGCFTKTASATAMIEGSVQ